MFEQITQTFFSVMTIILAIALVVIAFGIGSAIKRRFSKKV